MKEWRSTPNPSYTATETSDLLRVLALEHDAELIDAMIDLLAFIAQSVFVKPSGPRKCDLIFSLIARTHLEVSERCQALCDVRGAHGAGSSLDDQFCGLAAAEGPRWHLKEPAQVVGEANVRLPVVRR